MSEISKSLEEIKKSSDAVLVYFFSPGCVACRDLRPKVREMAESRFPRMTYSEIDASTNPSITADAGVFSAPTIVCYFDGRESIRESKYISVQQLAERIDRYYRLIFE